MIVHRRRRHRNPLAISIRELLPTALWAGAGGIAARWLPQMFLGDKNTSWIGYGANAGTTLVLGWLGDRFLGRSAGVGILIGGAVMTIGRIVSDLWGKNLVEFGGGLLGAYGDPSFDLGLYTPNQFVVPTVSSGPLMKTDYSGLIPVPAPAMPAAPGKPAAVHAAAAPAAGVGFAGSSRLGSRFAA